MKTGWLSLIVTFTLAGQVTYDRLRQADSEPGNWLSYSGNYSSHRYSRLSQITAGNVKRLKPVWMYQTAPGKVETTPLVIDGVMYITEPPSNVTALDTRTGRPLWKYQRTVPKDLRICCGQVNRGVAALGDLVWVGTIDAHLIALDAKTGQVRWDTVVADYKTGNSLTAAPLAVKDKIIIGMAGGEFGVRGFVDAYEAATGKRAWRFWTVPVAGERGSETWAGESWKTGSATTWVTGSYDPAQNLVLWGTGNPGPDWNEEVRGGDNLYSDCLQIGRPDRPRRGLPVHTIPPRTWFCGAREIRDPTGTKRFEAETTSTPIAFRSEDRIGHDVGYRFIRSRPEPGFVGHGKSGTRLERRGSRRRQPLLRLPSRARCGHRRAEVAFSVHRS